MRRGQPLYRRPGDTFCQAVCNIVGLGPHGSRERPCVEEELLSLPNPAYPGTTYLLTRRCVQREFWLLPTPVTDEAFGYALCLAAKRHAIAIHGLVVMSNHWHAVFTDPKGRASLFARDVHALFARCLNARLDRVEAIWSSDRLSLVRLVGPDEVFAELVYVDVNPVAAGLVKEPERWGGLRATPRAALRKPRVFRRPTWFFRQGRDATCPEAVTLEVTPPPCFAGEDTLDFVQRFEAAVEERVAELNAEAEEEGLSYLGMARVRAQSRRQRPTTREPRRGRRPTVACRDVEVRARLLEELVQFRCEYQEARVVWLRGGEDVVFPRGTFLMRDFPNVVMPRGPDGAGAAA